MSLSLNDYQQLASRTLVDNDQVWNALGLVGEAGEVADLIKKVVYHHHEPDNEKLAEELGDAFWYIAALASSASLTLEEVALRNIAKLERRYPHGFSRDASREREKPAPPKTRPESGGAVGGNTTSNLATNPPGGNR